MGAKFLIIEQGAEFMADALVNHLKKDNIEAESVEPSVAHIGAKKSGADIILIYGGEYLAEKPEVLGYIETVCLTEQKPLCVIGYDQEIKAIEETVDKNLIAYRFLRPVDMKILMTKLKYISEALVVKNRKRSILLVDDDAVFLKTMLAFLSDKYDVAALKSGKQALKYLETHTPDLILLDYDMPEMSGPQTLERIRDNVRTEDMPVIFLTGVSDKKSIVNVMAMKPEGYLLKNTGKEELLATVKHFFAAKKWNNTI